MFKRGWDAFCCYGDGFGWFAGLCRLIDGVDWIWRRLISAAGLDDAVRVWSWSDWVCGSCDVDLSWWYYWNWVMRRCWFEFVTDCDGSAGLTAAVAVYTRVSIAGVWFWICFWSDLKPYVMDCLCLAIWLVCICAFDFGWDVNELISICGCGSLVLCGVLRNCCRDGFVVWWRRIGGD